MNPFPPLLDVLTFEAFEEDLRRRLVAFLLSYGRPKGVACEAAQKAIVWAYKKLAAGEWPAAYTGAIFKKARRLAIDIMRQRARDAELNPQLDYGARSMAAVIETVVDVHAALGQIDEDEATVAWLSGAEGWILGEIAVALGYSVAKAHRVKEKAYAKLRLRLPEYAPTDFGGTQ